MKMELSQVIDKFITGDWGTEEPTDTNTILVSCVRGADIVPVNNGLFDNIPERYVSEKSIQKRLLCEGDLIIEKSGGSPTQSTGRIAYVSKGLIDAKGKVVCSNFCTAIRVKKAWNPLYIYYNWQQFYNTGVFFNFEGKTSGIKNLQLTVALSSFKIDEVDLKEQEKIVNVLYTIEQKMFVNRSINAKLEAMAKQLYDYWFVQFDFPDSNGRPYKSSGGKMLYNPKLKRPIPESWHSVPLSSFILNNKTGDWGVDKPSENYVKVGCIRGADIVPLNNLPQRYIKKKASLLLPWDVVIEVSGGSPTQATGRSAYITPGVIERNGGNITCSNFCRAFTIKEKTLSAYFFYTWNLFYDNNIMFNYEGKTSGIKNLMTDTFLSNEWMDIPSDLSEKFFSIVEALYKKKDLMQQEIDRLTALRDSLLPMLMNGQVSVL